jgi:hypothetical protein
MGLTQQDLDDVKVRATSLASSAPWQRADTWNWPRPTPISSPPSSPPSPQEMFSEMSIKVLGLTYLISMLHVVFDFLAFKNDIGFFSTRTDFTGARDSRPCLSARPRPPLAHFCCAVLTRSPARHRAHGLHTQGSPSARWRPPACAPSSSSSTCWTRSTPHASCSSPSARPPWCDHGSIVHGSMVHGSMVHGSMVHGPWSMVHVTHACIHGQPPAEWRCGGCDQVEAWKVKRIVKGGWRWHYGLPWATAGAGVPAPAPAAAAVAAAAAATSPASSAPHETPPTAPAAGAPQTAPAATDRHRPAAPPAAAAAPVVGVTAAAHQSAGEQLTEEIDALGLYWLSVALYPLVISWGVYSLVYYPQKSWWSWLINTLANGVYSFGFVMMTPRKRQPSAMPTAATPIGPRGRSWSPEACSSLTGPPGCCSRARLQSCSSTTSSSPWRICHGGPSCTTSSASSLSRTELWID